MITSLNVHNYRCFSNYRLSNLKRVNLLVGKNNSGKTCILEAVQLLRNPWSFLSVLRRRGEVLSNDNGERSRTECDVKHLFRGHELQEHSQFYIRASHEDLNEDSFEEAICFAIQKNHEYGEGSLSDEYEDTLGNELCFHFNKRMQGGVDFDLSSSGGVSQKEFYRHLQREPNDDKPPAVFLPTGSMSSSDIISGWKNIALTDEEELVTDALRLLEPDIERIAFVGSESRSAPEAQRGGVLVRMKHDKKPIPIGSMGDGIWRVLALAISVIRAQKGILLVDEIDTGLHHTALAGVWRMIAITAQRLDVQVFATSHSSDCVRSLAEVIEYKEIPEDSVSIQRIERDGEVAVPYSESEIVAAARHHTEVR